MPLVYNIYKDDKKYLTEHIILVPYIYVLILYFTVAITYPAWHKTWHSWHSMKFHTEIRSFTLIVSCDINSLFSQKIHHLMLLKNCLMFIVKINVNKVLLKRFQSMFYLRRQRQKTPTYTCSYIYSLPK